MKFKQKSTCCNIQLGLIHLFLGISDVSGHLILLLDKHWVVLCTLFLSKNSKPYLVLVFPTRWFATFLCLYHCKLEQLLNWFWTVARTNKAFKDINLWQPLGICKDIFHYFLTWMNPLIERSICRFFNNENNHNLQP